MIFKYGKRFRFAPSFNNARRVCVYVCLLDGFAVASASDDGCLLP